MKAFLARLVSEWKYVILPALGKLGIWAPFVIGVIDSSSIPVPIDALLAVYIWNNKSHFWIYCILAAAGSAIGGLVPYGIGRGGGELFLLKHVNRGHFDRLRLRFERQEFLAVMIPSMLPPPTPWKIFVFAAGVFEVPILPYLLAVFVGRLIRWGILAILVIKLGPGAVQIIAHHSIVAIIVVGTLAVVGFGIWWWRAKSTGKIPVE